MTQPLLRDVLRAESRTRFTPHFSAGLDVGGGLLVLSRRGVALRDLAEAQEVATINEAKARVLEGDGSSVGTVFGVTAGLGFHL